MRSIIWYRYIICSIFLLPAIIFQSVYPLISFITWEQLAESLYRVGLSSREVDQTAPSKIVVIEIDSKTWDAYGWPIDRSIYIKMLDKLKKRGHPWILSMLHFQELEKKSNESKQKIANKDRALAQQIKNYERYIGSGLLISPGSILDADQEDKFLSKIILSSSGKVPVEIPELPLEFAESGMILEAQKIFGFGARFGAESIVHCFQSYLTDSGHRGDFVILSSILWAAAYAGNRQISTSAGANWPRAGETIDFPIQSTLKVTYKLCDANPGVLSLDYLQQRGIERVSLASIVEGDYKQSLKNKIVILASSDMRSFRGPGYESGQNTSAIKEHLLIARFLDQIVSDRFILRSPLKDDSLLSCLPLITGGVLLVLSFFASPLFLTVINLVFFMIFVTIGFAYLGMNQFFIPVQTIYSLGLSEIFLLSLIGYLRYYGIKRQIIFAQNLNQALSQCNTLDEIQSQTTKICRKEFKKCKVILADFDDRLYNASKNPQIALELMESKKLFVDTNGTFLDPLPGPEIISTALTTIQKRARYSLQSPISPLILNSKIAISTEETRLGTLIIDAEFHIFEQHFVAELANILRLQVCQHWNRVKLLVDQKLLDYRILIEESRGKILGRFLTQVLVSKFTDSRTMDENLKLVLTPRVTKTALMQADIRGYSQIASQMSPYEMVQVLQGYFRGVVNAAQIVAQVKLIGDCIFLFIEEDSAVGSKTPTDLAFEIAQILVRTTEFENQKRLEQKSPTLNFGIAIHFAEVVVGNLSSDECIDYTVIGTEVNFVARMEELTKSPQISQVVGPNGIILSEQALLNLKSYSTIKPTTIDLKKLGIRIRSFPQVLTAYGLRAEEILKCTTSVCESTENTSPLKLAS